ncbi:MAG: arginyltransferase [Vicinamibacteria bacterium]|nr:arginyltransferase [Vicinamibacteria bacterium]
MRPDYSLIARMIASTLCQTGAEFSCPYVQGRAARFSGFESDRPLPEGLYDSLMQVNFRRNGSVVYRPDCEGCSDCRMIRIPVAELELNRAQRRCLKRNQDVIVALEPAQPTDEKHGLYKRYLGARHASDSPDKDAMDGSREEFESFLYSSCVTTEDLVFRDQLGKLLAVSVVDREPRSLSAVYCYFDPLESIRRSLGTLNILTLVEEAQRRGLDYVYLGYWLGDSRKMNYKSAFRPSEVWSPMLGFASPPKRR